MRVVVSAYPYLLSSLALAVVAGGLLACWPQHRTRALYSGLMSMPTSLLSFFFVPGYWRPARLVNFELGVEDLTFSFATGVIAWLIAERGCGGRLAFGQLQPRGIFRQLTCAGLFWAVFLPLWLLGMRAMDATLVGMATVAAVLLLGPCRKWWRLSLTGAFGFAFVYLAFLQGILLLYPAFFAESWNLGALWGWHPLGIPAEELAWAAAFGALWPLGVASAFGARYQGFASQLC